MFEYVLFESSHVYSIAYIKMYMGTILLTKYFEQMPRGKKAQQFSIRLLIMVTCHVSRVTCHVSHAPPLHEGGQRCPQFVSPAIFLTATFLLRAEITPNYRWQT